jgi:light-harvesting complex 1 beta chain
MPRAVKPARYPMSWRVATDALLRGLSAGTAERPRKGVVHMAESKGSVSGLSDDEAQEFHRYWVQGFVGFTAVAVVAHLLVWIWRPWL